MGEMNLYFPSDIDVIAVVTKKFLENSQDVEWLL